MRFVPIKSIEQQGQLMVHRARYGFVEQFTATLNRIRGQLSEMGVVLPLKAVAELAMGMTLPAVASSALGWVCCRGSAVRALHRGQLL
jgi:transposase